MGQAGFTIIIGSTGLLVLMTAAVLDLAAVFVLLAMVIAVMITHFTIRMPTNGGGLTALITALITAFRDRL